MQSNRIGPNSPMQMWVNEVMCVPQMMGAFLSGGYYGHPSELIQKLRVAINRYNAAVALATAAGHVQTPENKEKGLYHAFFLSLTELESSLYLRERYRREWNRALINELSAVLHDVPQQEILSLSTPTLGYRLTDMIEKVRNYEG